MITKIKKRDGRIVDFDQIKITEAIFKAAKASGRESREICQELANQVLSVMEKRFGEGMVPGVEGVQDLVEKVLMETGHSITARAYILYREKRKELREAKAVLIGVRDEFKLSLNAMKVLERRYLRKDEKGEVVETPAEMFRRVARNIAQADRIYDATADVVKTEDEFYRMMTTFEFVPNSPTLMNAGTELQQLAACFVLPVADTMAGIFDAVKNAALIHQTGGGTGFSFSRLRPKNDVVKSTGGIASGPVSFMRVFDVATDVIKQGGRRRGANMGILRVDHPDIIEFITAKEHEGIFTNFNISAGITENFMSKVKNNEEYPLINPRGNGVVQYLRAKDVFNLIVTMAWHTGDPGLVFLDRLNRDNPTPKLGEIEATNPCIASDTWITTAGGPQQVKDLIGKQFAAVVNGKLWETTKSGFFKTGTRPVYKLKTREGFEIRLTSNHPVRRAKKLTRYTIEEEWIKSENLKSGDKIVVNDNGPWKGWNGKYTEREGYLIGLLLGDGTIKKDKVVLSSWGNDTEVRAIASAYAHAMPHRSDFEGWVPVKGRDEYRLSTGYIKELTQELGLNPHGKSITKEIEEASSEFYRGLLRGLFDTDGSVQGTQSKGISIRLAQSNHEFLKAVQRMLLRLGIFSTIYQERRRAGEKKLPDGKGGLKEYRIKSQHELVISNRNMSDFYNKIGFGDAKKMGKLRKLLNGYRRAINRERFIATVDEFIPDGVAEVFDVQIPGINGFDANGLYVHNCGEQPLMPYEACNLGSINLAKMVTNGSVDFARLGEIVKKAIRFLDNVIDMGKYPLPEIEAMVRGNRKIGLGVMGFADALIKLGIPYNSQPALDLAEKIMSFIADESRRASEELAQTRGPFPNFGNSALTKPRRNATVNTIAPAGTISIIANCSSGIEPIFAVVFVRSVMEHTELFEVNPIFEEVAHQRGFFSDTLLKEIARLGSIQRFIGIPDDVKRIFATALDINPEWHVRMQAAFQKYVDNAVSKTVNLPQYATPADVERVYWLAYELGCKGVTVFRQGSRQEQVLNIGSTASGSPAATGKSYLTVNSEFTGCPTCTA
jgi:ribonucleoside-diphosphate reductase alpha chain